jgi:hypothetical protein
MCRAPQECAAPSLRERLRELSQNVLLVSRLCLHHPPPKPQTHRPTSGSHATP